MKLTHLDIRGVLLLEPHYFEDYRGYYCEVYSAKTLESHGIKKQFVQDNHSMSLKAGTLRGIHFQINPKPQTKLVRCTRGKILDIVVDLRKDSPTFKRWESVELSAENRKQIWIPNGFGHGFLALEDNTEVQYKVDEYYCPEYDRAIQWGDPELNIKWEIGDPIISIKDTQAPLLKDSDVNFTMELNPR